MSGDESSRVLRRMQLEAPLVTVLGASTQPAANDRQAQNWIGIARRLEPAKRTWRWYALVPVLAAAMVAGLLVSRWRVDEPVVGTTPPLTSSPAARNEPSLNAAPSASNSVASLTTPDLRLRGGAEFVGLAPLDQSNPTSTVVFEDGSTLTALATETVVERLAMTERDVTLRLASGTIDVHVMKGGRRKWTIETGDSSVEVVGTRFVVRRSLEGTEVVVQEGVVLVRGSRLPDGVRRLNAGESVTVPARTARSATSVATLMQEADTARRAGDLRGASALLSRVIRDFPSNAQTGVAAFQLALVTQQLGASPAEVVAAFEVALGKARGQSLRQDCLWRLVLALEQAGQGSEARRRAAQSLKDYPDGRYAKQLRERVPSPADEDP